MIYEKSQITTQKEVHNDSKNTEMLKKKPRINVTYTHSLLAGTAFPISPRGLITLVVESAP